MKKAFLSLEKIKNLQNVIGFLDNYKTPSNEMHHIGPNINTENVEETKLLRELGKINVRREQIIKKLMNKVK
jgi:hypothetical protein